MSAPDLSTVLQFTATEIQFTYFQQNLQAPPFYSVLRWSSRPYKRSVGSNRSRNVLFCWTTVYFVKQLTQHLMSFASLILLLILVRKGTSALCLICARWCTAAIRLPVGGCTGGLNLKGEAVPVLSSLLSFNNLLVPLCGPTLCP